MGKPDGELVATYVYRNSAGQPAHFKQRYNPKQFVQGCYDPAGQTKSVVWNLNGVQTFPYRLPELIAADAKKTVLVVEGEKAADRLAALDFVVTCNTEGAGKWKSSYNGWFAGRRALVLCDNDPVGRPGYRAGLDHGILVCNNLYGVAESVKLVSLPVAEGQDSDDWLDGMGESGKDRNQVGRALMAVADATPEYAPRPRPKDLADWFAGATAVYPETARLLPNGVRGYFELEGFVGNLWEKFRRTMTDFPGDDSAETREAYLSALDQLSAGAAYASAQLRKAQCEKNHKTSPNGTANH